jgi:hypothetical protein
MQTDNRIRRYYHKYAKKDSNAKSPSINSNWGYCFFLAGAGLGILFFAFILQDGFDNIVLSSLGIFSLSLVTIGLIILINNR